MDVGEQGGSVMGTVMDGERFNRHIGHRHRYVGDGAVIDLPVSDPLHAPGARTPRLGVLATVADIAAGSLVQPLMGDDVSLTVDLDVRRQDLSPVDHLTGTASLVKQGRTLCVVEVVFADTSAPQRTVAHSVVRFIRAPGPGDLAIALPADFSGLDGSMSRPFAEELGAVVEGPGVVTLDRWPYVLQSTGTVQGGAIALLAELAAESAFEVPVAELDVHFLSPVRTGPVRTSARMLWSGGAVVSLRDEGAGGRLVAFATARGIPG